MTNEELTLWIENNHKLIRKKANYWARNYDDLNLTYDEAYSIALEAVFNSTSKFDKSKGYKFSTYAGQAIDNAFRMMIRTRRNQTKYITAEVSLNDTVNDSDGFSTENVNLIEDTRIDLEQEVINKEFIRFLRKVADERVRHGGIALDLSIKGYTQKEIANKIGVTQPQCSRILKKVIHITKMEIRKQNSLSGLQSENLEL